MMISMMAAAERYGISYSLIHARSKKPGFPDRHMIFVDRFRREIVHFNQDELDLFFNVKHDSDPISFDSLAQNFIRRPFIRL